MKRSVRSDAAPETLVPLMLKLKDRKARGKPVIVAVAGGSGDGKGYLIERLAERLDAALGAPGGAVAVLSLDDYYVGVDRMRAEGIPHFDRPEALDLGLAAAQLAKARIGRALKIPRYDFASGERAGEQDFVPRTFVLVDGLFALRHPDLLALADLKVFVRSDHDSSMLRRLFRDAGPNGRTRQSSREVLEQYFTTVWPSKKDFIDPTAAEADIIVESCYDPAVEAHRAGPVQYQLKARGFRADDHVAGLCGAVRLGSSVRQTDRFMRPKTREHRGEILRLRMENGEVLLTYKGPFLSGTDGARHGTSPIALPPDAMRWFTDDYETMATFTKRRALFLAGDVVVARDEFDLMGNWFEVRAGDASHLTAMRRVLDRLCPQEPVETKSYFELWKERVPASLSAT